MDTTRKGEIAYVALMFTKKRQGVDINEHYLSDVGKLAKTIGIPFEDARIFVEDFTIEMMDNVFETKDSGHLSRLPAARRGEIAWLFLKADLRKRGLTINGNFRREVGNMAREMGIPYLEAMEFVEKITREHIDELFRKKPDTQASEVFGAVISRSMP